MEAIRSQNSLKSIQKQILTIVIIIGSLVAIFPLTEYAFIETPSPQFIWNGTAFRPVGVNYYPRTHPWTGTWEQYNATELAEDLDVVKSLGGNCIRTFIQWRLVEPEPWIYNNTIVDRIVDFFEVASEADMAVMFSFFDFGPPSWAQTEGDRMYINKTLIAHQVAQLEYILPKINETKAAFMWDLRNEPTSDTISMDNFVLWVENLTTTIRNLGDTHYIVVGGGYGNFEDPAPYAHLVDAVCMHFYKSLDKPHTEQEFEQYLKIFQATDKPVIVQEFGLPTSGDTTESMQAEYYNSLFALFDKNEIAGVMPWCLWDYGPNFWSEREAEFGLINYDLSWKDAAYVFRDYATGNRRPWLNLYNWGGLY